MEREYTPWEQGWNAYLTDIPCPYETGTAEESSWKAGFESAANWWPEQSR